MRGLPDDCRELATLRRFRDEFLVCYPEGRSLVERYYAEAPCLVPMVKVPREKARVWREIQETVAHIERGDYTDAIATYRSMFERLRDSSTSSTSRCSIP